MEKHKFIKEEFNIPVDAEFWCSLCDGNKIQSNDPNSGRWFLESGHIWNGIFSPEPLSDKYVMVVYAICSDCLEE